MVGSFVGRSDSMRMRFIYDFEVIVCTCIVYDHSDCCFRSLDLDFVLSILVTKTATAETRFSFQEMKVVPLFLSSDRVTLVLYPSTR